MVSKENPQAGRGPVVLDIGGDIGALIVRMPAWMEDLEVEIVPTGTDSRPSHVPAHHPGHHSAGHHRHLHTVGAPPHVAVVPRPAPDGSTVHSLVYPELRTGRYDLYVRPDGAVQLTATVVGGEVTQTTWPAVTPGNSVNGEPS